MSHSTRVIVLEPRYSSVSDRGIFWRRRHCFHPVESLLVSTSEIFEGERKFSFPNQNGDPSKSWTVTHRPLSHCCGCLFFVFLHSTTARTWSTAAPSHLPDTLAREKCNILFSVVSQHCSLPQTNKVAEATTVPAVQHTWFSPSKQSL